MLEARWFARLMLCAFSVLTGCQSSALDDVAQTPLHSERGGIGVSSVALESTPVPMLDARRSLAVTETAILSQFTLQAVLDQLAAQSGTPGLTGTTLFRQLWDTQNPAPGQPDLPSGAHCSDNGGQLNGFPYACRTVEGAQAGGTPPATMADYTAVGLFNRFDLAPVDGADCGEYRIVFALTKAAAGRNFIIFEAVLPNPRPGHLLEGCRAVTNFWRDLSTTADLTVRAGRLKSFYFTGLQGFAPVVHYAHYGQNARRAGQVRTNQFMTGPWLLREFKTERLCTGSSCTLRFAPVTVKTSPFGGLFNVASVHPLASEFQTTFFPAQVRALATGNVNTFNYTVPDRFNAGGSNSQSSGVDDYLAQFQGNATLRNRIQTELTAVGSSLTPEHVVARAQALSCGGCHQRSDSASLGGFTFPSSAGFVHSTESLETGPEGQRFRLSSALTGTFLPHRLQVLHGFLSRQVDNALAQGHWLPSSRVQAGQGFTVSVTMKNLGTNTWKTADGYSLSAVGHTWGNPTVPLAGTDVVAEGQVKTFTFTAIAPATPGFYTFQWRMRHEPAGVFGDASSAVSIEVLPAASAPLAFYPLPARVRLLDTRPGQSAAYTPGTPLRSEVLTRYSISAAPQIPPSARVLVARVSLSNYRTRWTVYDYVWRDTYSRTVATTDGQLFPRLHIFPDASWNASDTAYQRVGSGPLRSTEQLVSIPLDGTGAFSLRPEPIDLHIYDERTESWVDEYSFDATVEVVGYYAAKGAPGALYLHLFGTQELLVDSCTSNCGSSAPISLGGPLTDGQTRTVSAQGTFRQAGRSGQFTIPANARFLVGSLKARAAGLLYEQTPLVTIQAAGAGRSTTGVSLPESGWEAAQFLTPLSPEGAFSLTTDTSAYVTVDVVGYFSEQSTDDGNGAGLLYSARPAAKVSSVEQIQEEDIAFLSAAQSNMPINALAVSGRVDYSFVGEASCLGIAPYGAYMSFWGPDVCATASDSASANAQATFVRRLGAGQVISVGPGAPDVYDTRLELDVAGYYTAAD